MIKKMRTGVVSAALLAGVTLVAQQRLAPTAHPPVPPDLSSMWFATATSTSMTPALTNFVKGVRLLEDSDSAAAALPLVGASGKQSNRVPAGAVRGYRNLPPPGPPSLRGKGGRFFHPLPS